MRGKAIGIVTMAAALLAAASMWQAARAEAQSPGQSGDQESLPALVQRYQKMMNNVVVTPEGPRDGGDFGPYTPGTKTSGIQEALNYAKANSRNMYIAGGAGYRLDETLRVPSNQNFRLDAGECDINYTPRTGDAIVFDSQMNCWYKFGMIGSGSSDGAIVAFRPITAGPDNMSLVTVSVFEFLGIIGSRGALVDSGPPKKGEGVVGLLFDGTYGYLHLNHIFTPEVAFCDTGIYVKDRSFNNWIQCPFMHICRTHLQIGDPGVSEIGYNRIEAYMHGQGKEGSVGARIFGQKNLLTLTVEGTSEGNGLIFEDSARDNLVYALGLDGGFTNNAVVPTNRIITTWPIGFGVLTPSFPASGEDVLNRNPYPIGITVKTPGKVSDCTLTDANGVSNTVSAGLFAGQHFVLQPGEKIRFTHAAAPSWVWKAEQ